MTARRELARQAAENRITTWLEKHPSRWWRIVDVANGTNLPVPAVNNTLRMLNSKGTVLRDERKKRRNGKVFPVYQFRAYTMPGADHFTDPESAPPPWLCPIAPNLTPEQIRGIRTVLGFTGNLEAKKALQQK